MTNADAGGQMAAVAVIYILLPLMLLGLIVLALLIAFIYLTTKGIKGLPNLAELLLGYIMIAREHIINTADRSIIPVFEIRGNWARWNALRNRLNFRRR